MNPEGRNPPRSPASREALLTAALESVSDGFYALDADWRYVLFNRAAEAYFGVRREQVLGQTLWDVFPQGRGGPFEAACRAAMDEGQVSTFQTPSRLRPDRVVALRIAPMAGGISVSLTDITEPRRADEARREAEARFELAAAASRLGVWDFIPATGEMIFTPRARELWGFAQDLPLTAEQVRDAVHPLDRDAFRSLSRRALDPALRERFSLEFRVGKEGGPVRWIRSLGAAIFDGEGPDARALRFVGAAEDITAAKAVEAELRGSMARLRLALEAGRMAAWEADLKTRRLTASGEFNRLLGFPPDLHLTIDEVEARYRPGEAVRLTALARESLARDQRFFEAELEFVRPDGAPLWLLMRAELVPDGNGGLGRAVGVLMDISGRKADEERLRMLAREVDHRANNLLTIVQGAVALSTAPSVPEFKAGLTGRLAALARAHQLLAEGRWMGADLRRLAEDELRPFETDDPNRLRIEGPACALAPAAAQSVAMVLHELATNAAKYGGLSRPEGRVSLAWAAPDADGFLTLRWTESGGPPVRPPSRKGLGTAMLRRALGGPMNGRTTLTWDPQGLRCELVLRARPAEGG